MAWKHNGRTIQVGRAWVSDNKTKYPRQWNNLTDAEKKSAGLVWEDDPVVETFDDRFYWAKGIERKLEDENAVDENGKSILDENGNQVVNKGLKTIWIEKTKSTANGFLTDSDWYVTRKYETDVAIPSNISKYRADVRTASKTIEDKINGCSSLADFIKLFDSPRDKDDKVTGKAPINDFPNED